MSWFRRKKREAEAPPEAPAVAAPAPEEPAKPAASAGAEPKPARRRRGTRGGRGRKKKTETAAAETTKAVKAPKAAKEKETEKEKPARQRKRAPARRPPARKSASGAARGVGRDVKKEILVSVEVLEQTVAVLEDGKVVEVYLGRPSHRSIAGNIYKGVVDNVLPGMEASFVDIGLERNGFLYVDEIVVPELEGKRHGKRIQELISRGQEVLVQAVKDPMGTKGARLTTEISLPGRFLVYTPFGDGIGVSRRLEDAERERLKKICKGLELSEGGLIVRTAAEGATEAELAGDLNHLVELWSTIKGQSSRTKAPALVYQEVDLPQRIVRDLFISDFVRVVVDHDPTYREIVGYLKRTSPELAARVELYSGKQPLLEKSGVREAVLSTLNRRVDLPSGGYLVFDYAEAFTVIDVNTGRFVGGRGKASNARLEDTITKNNLEAVNEVVRQLRLRDIGGIIVIDFIDMANPKNRQLVEDALNTELGRDRTKTYVVEISPLGLVEMTRQNVTDGPREILTVSCATCDATGVVVSAETHAVEAERKLRKAVSSSRAEAFARRAALRRGRHPDRARREPSGRAREGARAALHVQDEEVVPPRPLRDRRIGQGRPDRRRGAHAPREAPRPSEKPAPSRSRRTTRARKVEPVALEDALAETPEAEPTADGDAPPAETPKKKTRRGTRGGRGRKRKTTAAAAAAGNGAPTDGAEPAMSAPTDVEAPAEVAADGAGANGEPPAEEKPRKKTRRGSRGGRRRKKKTAPESADGGAIATAEDAG